jgi:hypothetical protein
MSDDPTELIRAAFERAAAADPATNGAGVADAVRSAAVKADKQAQRDAQREAKAAKEGEPSEPKEPRDRGRLVMALGGVGLALALVGGVLAVALGGAPEAVTTANQTVHMYRCPGAEPVGTLHRGDVVRGLARSHDAKWLAVKFPNDVAEQVWVPANEVSSDVPAGQLPVARCSSKNSVEIASSKKTTTTVAPSTTATSATASATSNAPTTTARQATTTTIAAPVPTIAPPKGKGTSGGPSGPSGPAPTAPPPTNPPPTSPPTTAPPPTTVPPDTTPPSVSGLAASPTQIYENAGTCSATTAKSTAIAVSVSDAGGLASVTMSWKGGGVPFPDQGGATSRSMSLSSGKYRATLGPFGDVKSPGVTLVLTVTAIDNAGNKSTASINVTLFSCG